MMQATNFGNWHDDANIWRLDRPYVGRILLQREVSARAVIMGKVAGQETVKVPLAENEHVVQILAPDRADEPLHDLVQSWGLSLSTLPAGPSPAPVFP
jgi:hypothetical protein